MKTRDSILYHPIYGNFFAWFVFFTLASLTEYVNGSFGWVDGYGPIIYGFAIAATWTTRIHAYREAHRIEVRKININHNSRFAVRATIALAIGLTFHLITDGFTLMAVVRGLACAFFLGSVFWFVFDTFLSLDRGLEAFYVSNWYKTSRVDRWFRKFDSPVLWLVSKVTLLWIAVVLYRLSFEWSL